MTTPSPTSSTSSLLGHQHPFTTQVAGHVGVMMTTEDGSLLIKPALRREVEFYEALQHDKTLEGLRVFTAQFLGTLKLEGQVDPAHPDLTAGIIVQPLEGVDPKTAKDMFSSHSSNLANDPDSFTLQSIVLENLTYPFVKPNILDIKLGTVLYDDTASPEKKARMEKAAKDTTSGETGMRLTGFQVYDNVTSQPVHTPKQYGKALKPDQLSEGIARFFPLGVEPESPAPASGSASGTEDVEMRPPSSPSCGLPLELLTPTLQGIREDVALIKEILESVEVRMVAASLLIIYEADWDRAEEALTRYFTEEEPEESEEDDDEEEDDDDETKPKKVGPPFVVRLIDFAHTTLAPGQGPDRGVLLGLETLLKLLDGRLKEIAP